ncbi:unnamed protein product [Pleuronectes platessa]|uniref:Uncharacterized protein n=1 Tax=Pleuronectes platessa TaxID=8262 RepID=A0A9N7V251_PLEPL|nr:unnamed protein product [Pleuronectes platessa]
MEKPSGVVIAEGLRVGHKRAGGRETGRRRILIFNSTDLRLSAAQVSEEPFVLSAPHVTPEQLGVDCSSVWTAAGALLQLGRINVSDVFHQN